MFFWFFISFFIVLPLLYALRILLQMVWVGERGYSKPLTKGQERASEGAVMDHIDQFPDGEFAKDNPEYLEKYIEQVDISEIQNILTGPHKG